MQRTWIYAALILALGACSPFDDGAVRTGGLADAADPLNAAEQQLLKIIDEEWQQRLEDDPLLATRVGDRRGIDRLPDSSLEKLEASAEMDREFLQRLLSVDRAALGPNHRVSYDVFKWQLENRVAELEVHHYRFPLTSDSGFHSGIAMMPSWVPLNSFEDYRAYIARLRAIPDFFEQQIDLLRNGADAGWTLPRVVLEGYDHTITSHVVDTAEESIFYGPFENFPPGIPETARDELRRQGRKAIIEHAVVGYRNFLEFFHETYLPGARETLGATQMAADGETTGADYYAQRVRRFTNLDLSAKEVHEIGLGEVQRIRAEMDAILERVEWQGDFAGFLEFLRTDPRFYAETPEELLKEASYISKRMDGALPRLFSRFPRQPYGVEPVPDYLAPKYTAGRYVPAPLDSTRGGTYWVNTYDLPTRPLYALEALSLHEAVPGHHFQGALAQELDLPPFRQQLYISAFGEGWGLYSERLGLEVGFYTDPYSDFGRLTYEMWRACRLVVDTGLHAFGWTRQQAIDYLASNTALSLHEVTTEIDRYIAWPGQALSYKIGELKIRELRARAEKELGPRFDLRDFHDRLLASGAVPLPVLETEIENWIAEQGSGSAPSDLSAR